MKKLVFALFVVVSCSAMAIPAFALPQGGENEIEVSAGYFRAVGTGSGTFNGDLLFGRYFDNPAWEVGIRQGFNHSQRDKSPDFWTATTAPFVSYHFRNLLANEAVPFIGGQLGAVWNDEDFTGTIAPDAGIKFYIGDNTYFVTRYRYEWFFDKFKTVDETTDASHVVTAGLGFNW